VHHGDDEEPLDVRDLLLDGLVGRGGGAASDERVELAKDALAVLLLSGGFGLPSHAHVALSPLGFGYPTLK
jgi:hypothetical protein